MTGGYVHFISAASEDWLSKILWLDSPSVPSDASVGEEVETYDISPDVKTGIGRGTTKIRDRNFVREMAGGLIYFSYLLKAASRQGLLRAGMAHL